MKLRLGWGEARGPERGDGLIVDAASGRETLLALERRQCADCSRAEPAVRPSDVESFLDQDGVVVAPSSAPSH